mgnify:CR=1 FL=1
MHSSNIQIESPILYLVTHSHPTWLTQVTRLIGEGIPFVQIRDKKATSLELFYRTESVLNFIEHQGLETTVVLNDNVQVAKSLGIGVHLGQSDMLPEDARGILGWDVPIGWTIHDDLDLIASQERFIQYVGVGPIFPTTTKTDVKSQVPLERLQIVCAKSPLPVVAIGGINASNIGLVRQVKPWGIAMSSALMNAQTLDGLRH